MQSASRHWSATLFLAAGLYQFSPLKERCLTYCRSPDSFHLERMARWQSRRSDHGSASRIVLHGLLRRAHAVTVRRRRNGSALGRGLGGVGDGREAPAETGLLANCNWRWLVSRELYYVVLGGSTLPLSKLRGRLKPLCAVVALKRTRVRDRKLASRTCPLLCQGRAADAGHRDAQGEARPSGSDRGSDGRLG